MRVRAAANLGLLPTLGLLLGAGDGGDSLTASPIPDFIPWAAWRCGGAGSLGLPGLSSTAGTGGSFDDWGAALPLGQPLLDGGAASSAIDGAQQQARPRAIALEQARQAIGQSVQTCWAQHQAVQTQIEARRAVVPAA